MDIGTQIKETRKKHGLSQKKLAWEMGVGQPYISGIEAGKESPSPMFLKLFQIMFGVSETEQKGMKLQEKAENSAGKYERAVKHVFEGKSNSLLKYEGTEDTALISAGVLDFIAERDPELSLKGVLIILKDAEDILMQIITQTQGI